MSLYLPNQAQDPFLHSSQELLIKGVTHVRQPAITLFRTREQNFLTALKKINLHF